ncbi:MAG: inorganic phosphate transporter [Alphaproteobacteria bacterium]|nr:inorganic phosphate transporter [Alphaproteobacteria bacterium]
MEALTLVFLCSGLFLGWSLGANDASNVFGTAVGSRMVTFGTAAVICSLFVILGAVIDGAGAAGTLGQLGAVNAMAGSFMVALSAALTVYWMTKVGLPVSTGQAVVGAIIGWNFFSGSPTDIKTLTKILSTWVATPILAAVFSIILFKLSTAMIGWLQMHILRLDALTRFGLIAAGAFGSYALGANNIANVMGVFVASNPFTNVNIGGFLSFTAVQQLFLLGGLAIAVGVFTYSKRVMLTVGTGLIPLSPVAAFVVVVAHSIVLFLFASQGLEHFLAENGLPTIPLVPVSSSQAVIGAVIGIALLKGGRGMKWGALGNIASGWVTTPIIAAIVCFFALFFLQNVFKLPAYKDDPYVLSPTVISQIGFADVPTVPLQSLDGQRFENIREFRRALADVGTYTQAQEAEILSAARVVPIKIDPAKFRKLAETSLSEEQKAAVRSLAGREFTHQWQLEEALADVSPTWQLRPKLTVNKLHNRRIGNQRAEVDFLFAVAQPEE